jgi:hypothetical protein
MLASSLNTHGSEMDVTRCLRGLIKRKQNNGTRMYLERAAALAVARDRGQPSRFEVLDACPDDQGHAPASRAGVLQGKAKGVWVAACVRRKCSMMLMISATGQMLSRMQHDFKSDSNVALEQMASF